ncbi:hypothetical protein ACFP4H_16960 [Pseudophaeobacter arcticus]|uniref:hypothetical protein n=1 Tax=Pseudophaeobacter arcticus TaxID=385492 RepID=UPI0004153EF9|nr:hypothetical protein [Pseudophaeobacter arcticus]
MKISQSIRHFRRRMSIIFTMLVIAVFVASTRPAPPEWDLYIPLPALALMLLGGLYLFTRAQVERAANDYRH